MNLVTHPYIVVFRDGDTDHAKHRFPSFPSANTYAMAAGLGRQPGSFQTFDLRKPHIAEDDEGLLTAAFATAAFAEEYIRTSNSHAERERFKYRLIKP